MNNISVADNPSTYHKDGDTCIPYVNVCVRASEDGELVKGLSRITFEILCLVQLVNTEFSPFVILEFL